MVCEDLLSEEGGELQPAMSSGYLMCISEAVDAKDPTKAVIGIVALHPPTGG